MSRWEGESPLTQLEISPGYIPSAAAWPCPIREKGASNWFGKTRVLLASKRANRKKEVDYRGKSVMDGSENMDRGRSRHKTRCGCQVVETVSLSPTYGSDCSLALHTRLQHLSFQVLLDRLVVRRHFYLAIQIAKYLRMPDVEGSSRILAHWACYKRVEQTDDLTIKCLPQDPMSLGSKPAELTQDIYPSVKQTQLDREQVARDIADKLGYAPGVSYSEIAKKAADCGRTQLAIKMTIRNYPLAQSLYLKYCRDHNIETLRDIYDQEDNHNAKAAFYLKESYEPKDCKVLACVSRYWWLRILSLAALSEWSELDKFAKTKKSPIGYEVNKHPMPFVDVCLKYDKRSEAQKYLTRVKDDLKVKYYLKLGMLEEANNVATEHRDVQALLFVQSRCGAAEKTLSDQIDATIAQLTAKK
uniref:Vps16 C-terminal domain-containing protein n=1 Tax=Timema shepardi TaxID=629360 RepID=A0A7R9AX26_TIMSH|nr:unnamed protein product [Timema shepardi]